MTDDTANLILTLPRDLRSDMIIRFKQIQLGVAQPMRAQYHYDVVGDVVVIYDDHRVGDNSQTVTNAAEAVIAEVGQAIGGFCGRRVIYRDSDGVFDEITLDAQGRFAGFGFLRAGTLDGALEALTRTPAC